MNHQLVIIGNGFDVSHGLNLKYSDFLINYFHKCLYSLNESKVLTDKSNPSLFYKFYSDELITLQTRKWTDVGREESLPLNIKTREWYEKLNISEINKLEDLIEITEGEIIEIEYNKDFSLVERILLLNQENWVDFESCYFDCLVEIKKNPNHKIEDLNFQWNFLKSELIKYLKYCQNEFNLKKNQYDSFRSIVRKYLYDGYESDGVNVPEFEKYLFLNFNFTHVVKVLYNFNSEIIQIHGNIDEEIDSILFGYGYTEHEEYKSIISHRDNTFKKNLKDVYYTDREHKPRLLKFIKENLFDVKLVGHSCGESDISLLDVIFNHHNCKSIKIYSRNIEGFRNIRDNIFRFPSHNSIKNKITSFDSLKHNIIGQYPERFPLINEKYKRS